MSRPFVASDEYETLPIDLGFLLRSFCCHACDVVWEPFVSSDGFAQRFIGEQGFRQPPADQQDFFERAAPPPGTTIVITNPPFSRKQEVLARLVAWNVPFVLLLPTIVLQRDFFIDLVRLQPDRFRVVLPTKTVRFHRSGVLQQSPAFKSAYYCFDCSAARCACQERVALALQSLSIDICLVDQE